MDMTIEGTLTQTLRARRFFVASVVSWVVMGILGFFVVLPRVQSLLDARQQLELRKQELTQVQEKLNFLAQFQSNEYQKMQKKVNQILPSVKPFLTSMYALEQVANKTGVDFVGISVSPGKVATESATAEATKEEAKDGLQKLLLEVRVVGSSKQIQAYMDMLPTVAPAFNLDAVTLSEGNSGSGGAGKGSTLPLIETQSRTATGSGEQSAQGDLQATNRFEAKIRVSALYAPVVVTLTGTQPLPKIDSKQQEFAQSLLEYVAFDEVATPGAQQQLGKDDPFGL